MRASHVIKAALALSTLCLAASPGQASEAGRIVPVPSAVDGVKAWVELSREGGRMRAAPRIAVDIDALRESLVGAARKRVREDRSGKHGNLSRTESLSAENAAGGKESDVTPPTREPGYGEPRLPDERRTPGNVEESPGRTDSCLACDFRTRVMTGDTGPIWIW